MNETVSYQTVWLRKQLQFESDIFNRLTNFGQVDRK